MESLQRFIKNYNSDLFSGKGLTHLELYAMAGIIEKELSGLISPQKMADYYDRAKLLIKERSFENG